MSSRTKLPRSSRSPKKPEQRRNSGRFLTARTTKVRTACWSKRTKSSCALLEKKRAPETNNFSTEHSANLSLGGIDRKNIAILDKRRHEIARSAGPIPETIKGDQDSYPLRNPLQIPRKRFWSSGKKERKPTQVN